MDFGGVAVERTTPASLRILLISSCCPDFEVVVARAPPTAGILTALVISRTSARASSTMAVVGQIAAEHQDVRGFGDLGEQWLQRPRRSPSAVVHVADRGDSYDLLPAGMSHLAMSKMPGIPAIRRHRSVRDRGLLYWTYGARVGIEVHRSPTGRGTPDKETGPRLRSRGGRPGDRAGARAVTHAGRRRPRRATAPAHRTMLERASAALDAQLAVLDEPGGLDSSLAPLPRPATESRKPMNRWPRGWACSVYH